jgi:hypothetical protein
MSIAFIMQGNKKHYCLPDHHSFVRYEEDEVGDIWLYGAYAAMNLNYTVGFNKDLYTKYVELCKLYDSITNENITSA